MPVMNSGSGDTFREDIGQANYVDVNGEADRLKQRLIALEERLASLPWKVETQVSISDDLSLKFARYAKSWALWWVERLFCQYDPNDGSPIYDYDETLLRDTSISIVTTAISKVPALIDAMRDNYLSRITLLRKGHDGLDQIERSLSARLAQDLAERASLTDVGDVVIRVFDRIKHKGGK
jgi:hypothetical protein